MTTALIDGDIFAYEIAANAEDAVNWGDDFWTTHADEGTACANLIDRIEALAEKVKATRIIVALSDDTANWRKTVLPTYKANRATVRKPMLLKPLKAYLHEAFEVFQRPTLEADDVLGILATWSKLAGEKVIITKDKDLQTVPGLHLKAHKPQEGVFEVTPEQADLAHLTQALTGDVTDGYKGCPGIGPKKAERLLDVAPEERWAAIVAAFEKAGLTEADALQQARVARICRACDYDMKRKEVKLWTP